MLCIYCHNQTTEVTNSRPHKKEPSVWRRRRCTHCDAYFTTQEKPVFSDSVWVIAAKTGAKSPFYQGKLVASIAKSFAHDEPRGAINALPLSDTIISMLLFENASVSTAQICALTHTVLKRFDPSAALQYALSHHLEAAPARRRKGI